MDVDTPHLADAFDARQDKGVTASAATPATRTEPLDPDEGSGEICVGDTPDVGVSQPTVSHHLRKSREAGLVECQRRRTWVHDRAVPDVLNVALRTLRWTG